MRRIGLVLLFPLFVYGQSIEENPFVLILGVNAKTSFLGSSGSFGPHIGLTRRASFYRPLAYGLSVGVAGIDEGFTLVARPNVNLRLVENEFYHPHLGLSAGPAFVSWKSRSAKLTWQVVATPGMDFKLAEGLGLRAQLNLTYWIRGAFGLGPVFLLSPQLSLAMVL